MIKVYVKSKNRESFLRGAQILENKSNYTIALMGKNTYQVFWR